MYLIQSNEKVEEKLYSLQTTVWDQTKVVKAAYYELFVYPWHWNISIEQLSLQFVNFPLK